MKLDVLAIGAHPDDVELSCGGTVAKLVGLGRTVGIVDLTRGELGTRGSKEIREREAQAAAAILGVSVRENLDLGDGNIEVTRENKLLLIQLIRLYRPDVLLFPYPVDRHPDHEHAHLLAREAWFYSGLEKIRTAAKGKSQEPFRPRVYYHFMQWFEFTPTFIVDVTSDFEKRMACVKAYKSQFYDPSSNERETILSTPAFLEMLRTRAEYYGDKIGKKYGEPFYGVSPVAVNDLVSLNT